jgi:drug/metabolite transporter (DMT)-like permease
MSILLFLLCAFSASTFTIGKAALQYTIPMFLIGIRLIVAGIIFLLYYYYKYRELPSLHKHDYWVLAQVSFASFYFAYAMEFWALQYMTSSKTALLYNLSPVIAACFSYVVFNEKMTVKKIIGLAICLLSFFPILIEPEPTEGHDFFFLSLPEIALFAAVISFTYGWVIMRKAIKRHFIPTVFVNGVGMVVGGIVSLLTVYIFEIPYMQSNRQWIHPWLPITQVMPFLLWSFLLVAIGSVLCYIIYGYLLHKYTATFVTLGELATPLFAALYGWAFLHESISLSFFFSMIVLGIGSYIFYQEEKRLGYFEHS